MAAGILVGGALLGTWGPRATRLESQKGRFSADAVAAGALTAMVVGMFCGLLFTRTRGAWVGTAVALGVGLVLFPWIAKGTRLFTPMVRIFGGTAAVVALSFTVYVFAPGTVCGTPKDRGACWTYAETIRSIPAAFDPNRTDYGKGQGTRRYLWSESPRVLVNHSTTLQRYYDDRQDYAQFVTSDLQREFDLDSVTPATDGQKKFDSAWRAAGVWLFGIGIETYRYAFMSHKSMLLEKLDPMTNHDNPHNNYLYVLASFGLAGLAAYVWLLVTLLGQAFRRFREADSPWTDRAMAFGVVLSFFSYSVYSIAGFDSVACSVFLFFLLGAAAALFQPNIGETPARLTDHLRRQWGMLTGRKVEGEAPTWMAIAIAVVMVPLLLLSVQRAFVVLSAEQALVADRTKPKTRADIFNLQIKRAADAVRTNPTESFYKQKLGNAYADASQFFGRAADVLESKSKGSGTPYRQKAAAAQAKAEALLYASLDHAWAPENVYISLFQLYYRNNDLKQAERALARALVHSPHLGAVRANLASLQLQRRGLDEALANAKWVNRVAP
ncbi:MAG: hypothetical protein AAFV29_13155, partial [Myxococcota bacterium]